MAIEDEAGACATLAPHYLHQTIREQDAVAGLNVASQARVDRADGVWRAQDIGTRHELQFLTRRQQYGGHARCQLRGSDLKAT